MNQKNKIIEVYGLWFADLVAIGISFALATYIRFGNFKDMGDKGIHFQVCLVFLLFCTIYSFFIDWNRNFLRRSILKEIYAVLQYNVLMLLVTQTIMYFLKWADVFSRGVMIYFAIINSVFSLLLHLLIKNAMKFHYKSDQSKVKLLVITEKNMIPKVEETLMANLDISYQIVQTIVAEDMQPDFLQKATLMALDEVFIYAPELPQKKVQEIINSFDEMGVNCHYCVELPGTHAERSKIDDFGSYSVITYTRFQSSYKRLLIKRVMDIAGGLVGMLITLIFFPFVAIAIKADSPGPVFFSQVRIGRNGRRFKIYKFRSMYMDAEERKKELMAQNNIKDGMMFKMDNDPRIIKGIGNFIRDYSLDEFPQFWNVLKGDMSLVGTRPPTEDEWEKYDLHHRARLAIKPGITGMWQISGRSDITDFEEVVRLDTEYIKNWDLGLDIKILLKTVLVVIGKDGAK